MVKCTMFRFDRSALFIASLWMPWPGHAAPWSALGQPITEQDIADWNIDVRPDGRGLPKGHGNVAEGQAIYDAQCASCHGTFGESPQFMVLAGGIGSLKTSSPQRTVGSKLNYATTLWDYINRAMPFNNAKSLTPNEVYAVTAYVLNLNEIVPADAVLDETTLPQIKMPNRDGFTQQHGMGNPSGKPDVHNIACMQACEETVKVTAELPPGFMQQMYGDIRQHFRALAFRTEPATVVAKAVSATGPVLISTQGCTGCHDIDKGLVGPAFADVAQRYAGAADAALVLATKIRAGGSGVWGTTAMPPQTQLSEPALKTILAWILAGAPRD